MNDEYIAEAYSRWVEIAPLYNFDDGTSFSRKIRRLQETFRPDLADQLEKAVKSTQASESSGRE